jgi:hypothetical protein
MKFRHGVSHKPVKPPNIVPKAIAEIKIGFASRRSRRGIAPITAPKGYGSAEAHNCSVGGSE